MYGTDFLLGGNAEERDDIMEKEKATEVVKPNEQAHTGKTLATAAERTVKSWPQWKRDTYNNYFATASGAKKY